MRQKMGGYGDATNHYFPFPQSFPFFPCPYRGSGKFRESWTVRKLPFVPFSGNFGKSALFLPLVRDCRDLRCENLSY